MQIPIQNGGENWGERTEDFLTTPPTGSRIVRLEPGETEPRPSGSGSSGETEPRPSGSGSSRSKVLTSNFAAAGCPDISFDGRRMLFVGRRAVDDENSVWEMGVEGGDARKIVTPPGTCLSAIYLSTIYTIDAERPEYQIAVCSVVDGAPAIFTCRMDGSRLRRITFTPNGAFDPVVLRNGRIRFTTSAPHVAADATVFQTMNPDGTDVFPLQEAVDRREGEGLQTLIHDDPAWHNIFPAFVRACAEPAGRSSVVRGDQEAGELYCLDAYRFDLERDPDSGDRRIARMRIFQASLDRHDGKGEHVLGEVPVESDGSFFVRVPAQTPLRMQTLNEAGDVLRDMQSWMWVMPDEHRGCIGCHEDRRLTPPNRNVKALRASPHALGVEPEPHTYVPRD